MVDYTIFLSEIDFYPSYNVFPYGFLPIDIDMLSNTTDDRFIDWLRMEYFVEVSPERDTRRQLTSLPSYSCPETFFFVVLLFCCWTNICNKKVRCNVDYKLIAEPL